VKGSAPSLTTELLALIDGVVLVLVVPRLFSMRPRI
jgi:hypothetical protein